MMGYETILRVGMAVMGMAVVKVIVMVEHYKCGEREEGAAAKGSDWPPPPCRRRDPARAPGIVIPIIRVIIGIIGVRRRPGSIII